MGFVKEYKWKYLNGVLLIASVCLYLFSYMYWQQVCVGEGSCTYSFMEGVLSSLKTAGIILSLIFLSFLFISQGYFKRYFTHWFWWLFLIAYAISASTDPIGDGIMQYDRSQVVMMLGVIGLVQALIFIFLHHRKSKKSV